MNTFGQIFRLTSFGESHGEALGGVVDGMPAGIRIDTDAVQYELDRRRPGQSHIVTARKEPDRVKFLSGIIDDVTTGTPIGFVIENTNQHSSDYREMADTYRPSHADFTYDRKYGFRDYRGGGRSSARETVARVVAGAVARQALAMLGVDIVAYTSQVGDVVLSGRFNAFDRALIESNPVRCPDKPTAERMCRLIEDVKSKGDTIGGVVTCVVRGVPIGLGEPVFDKLQARLAYAMMGINAAKGFDYGMGFDGVGNRGSEMLDEFATDDFGKIYTKSNNSGGIQGGISNGADIYFRVAFKPVATLLREVPTIHSDGTKTVLKARGRHDPCVLPRAVPIVEAMAAMTIFDAYLMNRNTKI
ncbi:MAG: chorismate synthase [Muribaculum sp.]|nr:chorismate synthase [Muribaculum sp.]